jgi:hypothetical protein
MHMKQLSMEMMTPLYPSMTSALVVEELFAKLDTQI